MKRLILILAIILAASLHAQTILPRWETPPAAEQILVHEGFTVSYNNTTLCPNWSAWELTPGEAAATLTGRTDFFTTDPLVEGRQAQYRDYSRNGMDLDRGHMAPSADFRWSVAANGQTFYLTNICPQNHALNEGLWLELEQRCRTWAKRYGTAVHIVCGPVFEGTPQRIGEGGVAVPSAFFKAILLEYEGRYHAVAFIMPNRPLNLLSDIFDYCVPVSNITRITGIDPFPGIGYVESQKNLPWDIPWKKPKKK